MLLVFLKFSEMQRLQLEKEFHKNVNSDKKM